jgi:ribophorin I
MARLSKKIRYSLFSLCIALIILPIATANGNKSHTSDEMNTGVPISAANSFEGVTIKEMIRNYRINDYGLVVVSDEYKFQNNNSNSLSRVQIGLNNEEYSKLVFYDAQDNTFASMGIHIASKKNNGTYMLEILLNQPIKPYSSGNITLTMVFKDLLSLNPYTSVYSDSEYPVFPITPYLTESAFSIINIPADSSQITFYPETATEEAEQQLPVRYFYLTGIQPFEKLVAAFQYQNYRVSPLKLVTCDRVITVNPWGYIRVNEEHKLLNDGPVTVGSFSFRIPGNALNFSAADYLGAILGTSMTETLNDDGTKNATFSLSVNRALLGYKNVMSYRIEYILPFDSYYTRELLTNNFEIDHYTTKADFLILNQTTEIRLIGATDIIRTSYIPDTISKSNDALILRKVDQDITIYHSLHIDVSYQINSFSLLNEFFIFMIIFISIFGAYVFVRNRTRDNAPESEEEDDNIPIRELRQFVTLYEEKNALQLDIEKSDEDLIRRRMQKKAYNKTVKILGLKIKEINEEIRPFKTRLLEAEGKIQNIIQKLDYLEAEKISTKDSIKLLQDRYKKGKLPSKSAYNRLSDDLLKRLTTTQHKIDRYVNELRAYLI